MKAKRAKWGQNNIQRLQEYDKDRRVNLPRKTYNYDDKVRFWIGRAGICLCCAKPIAKDEVALAQLDHINPLSKGGSDTDENIALAHKRCNTDKLNKKLEDHWIWRYNRKMDAVKLSWFELDNIIIAARYRE
jgi:5-methylcytosine-specific restriction endonuclease McrA